MKSRQASPVPKLIRMRTFRLDTAVDPPKLEAFSFDVTSNGTGSTQGPTTFTQLSESPESITAAKLVLDRSTRTPARMPVYGQESPIMTSTHNDDHTALTQPFDAESSVSISPFPPKRDTLPSEVQSLQWSAAVGHATTGKSGRVIERLMGENDRLRRELNLNKLRYEEEAKRSEMARSKLENLQATNDNLVAIHEVEKAALARRERKIEDLKTELEVERGRREMAEQETKETSKERDEVVARSRRELMEEKEKAKKSTTQYEVLSSSWKSLTDGYRHQMDKLKADIKILDQRRAEDHTKLERLEVVMEQTRRESEKMSNAKQAVSKTFEDYKAETEEGIREIRERAERNEQASRGALEEMEKVVGEMRYVINLSRDLKEAE